MIKNAQKPLLLAFRLDPSEAQAVLQLAEQWGCPLAVEPLSQLSQIQHPLVVPATASVFETLATDYRPDLLVQLGPVPAGKAALDFIKNTPLPLVEIHTRIVTQNPFHKPGQWLKNPLQNLATELDSRTRIDSVALCKTIQLKHQITLQKTLEGPFSEAQAIQHLINAMPQGNLFLGNSLTLRLAGQVQHPSTTAPRQVFANRGVSGIDGLIATSVGVAMGNNTPTLSIIGDISALYDLNALQMLVACKVPVVVVILNNFGGEIFAKLPVGKLPEANRYFKTQHALEFESAAALFKLPYQRITALKDLKSALTAPRRSRVMECVFEPPSGQKPSPH
ncbi:MAG: thiamine pyrophosphate-dependent enzyme [Candidatus Margulisiibacteriota bacterium]